MGAEMDVKYCTVLRQVNYVARFKSDPGETPLDCLA